MKAISIKHTSYGDAVVTFDDEHKLRLLFYRTSTFGQAEGLESFTLTNGDTTVAAYNGYLHRSCVDSYTHLDERYEPSRVAAYVALARSFGYQAWMDEKSGAGYDTWAAIGSHLVGIETAVRPSV